MKYVIKTWGSHASHHDIEDQCRPHHILHTAHQSYLGKRRLVLNSQTASGCPEDEGLRGHIQGKTGVIRVL